MSPLSPDGVCPLLSRIKPGLENSLSEMRIPTDLVSLSHKRTNLNGYLHTCVHHSVVHNRQKVEAACVPDR